MGPRNIELVEKAKLFTQDKLSFCTYVCLTGSSAREEADEFSDIDIIGFTGREQFLGEHDLYFQGDIVQVEVKSILEFPNKSLFSYNPWHFKYLTESIILKDNNGELSKLQGWAKSYYASIQGQRDVIHDVENIVNGRKYYAQDQLEKRELFEATHAAMGAWAEAALLYQFLKYHTNSSDAVIPNIENLAIMNDLRRSVPFTVQSPVDIDRIRGTLSDLRAYLRDHGFEHIPGISTIQEDLEAQKTERLVRKEQWFNLHWHCYSEAFLIILRASQQESFTEYFQQLPSSLQQGLNRLGFITLSTEAIHTLIHVTDTLMELSRETITSEQI